MDLILSHLLRRQTSTTTSSTPPPSTGTTNSNSSSFSLSPAQQAATAIAITLGVLIIIAMSYFCCCHKKGPRPAPDSYLNKDVELGDAEPGQVYGTNSGVSNENANKYGNDNNNSNNNDVIVERHELQSPVGPMPQRHVTTTAPTEIRISEADAMAFTADGHVPADEQGKSVEKDMLDPPPEYPGSPIQRPAELATRR